MEDRLHAVAAALLGALAILFALRRRARAAPELVKRDLASRALDSAEHVHSIWLYIQAAVILIAVVGVAFFNNLIADILSATLILMVAVWLWVQRKRESGTPLDQDAP